MRSDLTARAQARDDQTARGNLFAQRMPTVVVMWRKQTCGVSDHMTSCLEAPNSGQAILALMPITGARIKVA